MQTVDYANALFDKTSPFDTDEFRERFAKLQPDRYAAIFDRANPADVTALVDESAVLREVAEPAVMVQQLTRVLSAPCEVRVVTLRAIHPGVVIMSVMETSEPGPVGYVEGWRDSEILVNGDDDDVQLLANIVREIGNIALPALDSRRMIENLLKDWETLRMTDRRRRWWKSSHSNTPNNGCVEVGDFGATRGIGDTTYGASGYLEFTPADFHAFIEAVKNS